MLNGEPRGVYEDRRVTVTSFLRQWLAVKKKELAPNTYAGYAACVERDLIPTFGHYRLPNLRPKHIARWIAASPHLRPLQLRAARRVHGGRLRAGLALAAVHRRDQWPRPQPPGTRPGPSRTSGEGPDAQASAYVRTTAQQLICSTSRQPRPGTA